MVELKNKIKVYMPFAIGEMKKNMVYKASFYLKIISGIIYVFISCFLWNAVYHEDGMTLMGFTKMEMLRYVFMSYIVSGIVYIEIASEIGEDIADGSIAINLIKPINYRTKLLFQSMGNMAFKMIMPSAFLCAGFESYLVFLKKQNPIGAACIVQFLISCILSFVIYFLFDFCFGLLSFYSSHIWGLLVLKTVIISFFAGQIIPLNFFPKIIRNVMGMMPFASMNYVPVMIYLNKMDAKQKIMAFEKQIIWIIILLIICNWLWSKAVKKLAIAGG